MSTEKAILRIHVQKLCLDKFEAGACSRGLLAQTLTSLFETLVMFNISINLCSTMTERSNILKTKLDIMDKVC